MKGFSKEVRKQLEILNRQAEKDESTIRYFATGDKFQPIIGIDLSTATAPNIDEFIREQCRSKE